MTQNLLIEHLPETLHQMQAQLEADFTRWGETWRARDVGGQERRIYARLRDYFDQWENAGQPIPWVKIACLAHIALIREAHPELLREDPERG